MANTIMLSIAKDFSDVPGGRWRSQGEHSGQEFREDVLAPRFEEAERQGAQLLVDLTGGWGYATSFLEESFGGLARSHGARRVLQTVRVTFDDDPFLAESCIQYITDVLNDAPTGK